MEFKLKKLLNTALVITEADAFWIDDTIQKVVPPEEGKHPIK